MNDATTDPVYNQLMGDALEGRALSIESAKRTTTVSDGLRRRVDLAIGAQTYKTEAKRLGREHGGDVIKASAGLEEFSDEREII